MSWPTVVSSSRRTCGDPLAALEKMNTTTGAAASASRIALVNSAPGGMSRGAIQHVWPEDSRTSTTCLAMAASSDAWQMKTPFVTRGV